MFSLNLTSGFSESLDAPYFQIRVEVGPEAKPPFCLADKTFKTLSPLHDKSLRGLFG
jgi:hypothetical protein